MKLSSSLFIALLMIGAVPVHGAAPLTKVIVTTVVASEREGALYVAQDQVYFAATVVI